jgi:acyl carrier protein
MEIKLIEFIKNEFVIDDGTELLSDTKLISSGIIDSFSLVSVQLFIEREFGKKIPNSKMTVENCDSVTQIINLINQY